MFDREFKLQAIRMIESGQSATQVSRALGVSKNSLSEWKKRYAMEGSKAFRQGKILTEEQSRVRELERKLKDTQLELEILKKAVAIFSKARQ